MSPVTIANAVLALLLVFAPAFWLASRRALRSSTPTRWLRRLLVALWGVAVLTYATLFTLGHGLVVRTTLAAATPISDSSLAAEFVVQLTAALTTAAVTLAVYATLVPAIRDVQEIDLPMRTALRSLGRYALALSVLFAAVLALLLRALADDGPAVYWLLLLGAMVALAFANPVLAHVFRDTREPTSAERERLRERCDHSGLSVSSIVILDDMPETAGIHIYGVPSRRQLFVTERVLEAFDDETLEAIFAVHAGKLRAHYRGYAVYSLLGYLALGVGVLLFGSGTLVTIFIVLVAVLALPTLWAARRAFYRADDYAAAVVGRDELVRALEYAAEEQNLELVDGGRWVVFKSRPPLGRRLARLREKSARSEEMASTPS
ncbi:M48 family metalloprotease [Natrialba chahannaoensis]|uniref:M48 family metalloprotease n=1 Tax=Natrialba chahannaoensis TaxID=68911 RepID=UPI0006777213|nr:M48 family metalloprotease [Natrialba chahannaoensis]